MAVYGFNENLEKVPVIRLSKNVTIAGGDVGSAIWTRSELETAGVDTSDIANYEVVSISWTDNHSPATYYTNYVLDILGGGHAPFASITPSLSSEMLSVRMYNVDSSQNTFTVRVTLQKVA